MKRRGFSFWVDMFFGVIWPGVLVAPLLFFYCIGFPLWILFLDMKDHALFNSSRDYWELGRLLLVGFAGLGPLLGLGVLIGFGVDWIGSRPKLRVSLLLAGLVGLALGSFSFFSMAGKWFDLLSRNPPFRIGTWRSILFEDGRWVSLGLIGPLVVGSKYWLLLWEKRT